MAQIPVTVPDQHIAIARAALAWHLGNAQPATQEDFNNWVQAMLLDVVRKYKADQRRKAINSDVEAEISAEGWTA